MDFLRKKIAREACRRPWRYLSERAIGAVGGVLFIGFGVMTGLSLFS